MRTVTISKLAQEFGLSRSTLLYYDRIALLAPSGRTRSGYRYYSEEDRLRLERICHFRQAGLPLRDISVLLSARKKPHGRLIEKRLIEIGSQILDLRRKQFLLSIMLKRLAKGVSRPAVDKTMWVEMLRAAGLDDEAMGRWHGEFERRAPEAHHEFLLSLGIPETEALQIREWSRGRPAGHRAVVQHLRDQT